MIILLYIIIGLWLAKGVFEIVRALIMIACGLLCGAVAVCCYSVAFVLGAFEWLWRQARWTS